MERSLPFSVKSINKKESLNLISIGFQLNNLSIAKQESMGCFSQFKNLQFSLTLWTT